MTISQLKANKWVLLIAFATSLFLSFAVITPTFAAAQREMQGQKNCAKVKYDTNKEIKVLGDMDNGTVSLSYTDDSGISQETWLDLRGNSTNCTPQAKKLISLVKESQNKYNADMCAEATAMVEGKIPLPELDGKTPTMEATKIYQKATCAQAANKL